MASIPKIALCVAAAFSTVVSLPAPVVAQTTASIRGSLAETAELEQLVAPIALYPDALLSQILMASTYPLEVVEAARWQKAHPDLQGADLEAALLGEDWDPSVKSLVAFPNVLAMMNERLSWTSRLGDVFLAQQEAVMDTVQALRGRAQAAGNLKSSPEQTVTVAPASGSTTVIRIEPARPEVVYVPVYNPTVVYGPWLYPAYMPFYWHPPGYSFATVAYSFGVGLFIGHALWGGYDWHAHRVRVVNVYNYNHFSRTRISHAGHANWHHDPHHRRNVAYRTPVHGYSFHGGDHRFTSRENFRPRADVHRRELPHIDRTALVGSPGRGDGGGGEVRGTPPRTVEGRPGNRPGDLSAPTRPGDRSTPTNRPAPTFSDRNNNPVNTGRRPEAAPRGQPFDRGGRDVTVRTPNVGTSRPTANAPRQGGWTPSRVDVGRPQAGRVEAGPMRGGSGPQMGRPFGGGREIGSPNMGRGSMSPGGGGGRSRPSGGGGHQGGRFN